jgi:hypothetical protein
MPRGATYYRMGEFGDYLHVFAPDGGNRMGGVTCDPFHAQIDNNVCVGGR